MLLSCRHDKPAESTGSERLVLWEGSGAACRATASVVICQLRSLQYLAIRSGKAIRSKYCQSKGKACHSLVCAKHLMVCMGCARQRVVSALQVCVATCAFGEPCHTAEQLASSGTALCDSPALRTISFLVGGQCRCFPGSSPCCNTGGAFTLDQTLLARRHGH